MNNRTLCFGDFQRLLTAGSNKTSLNAFTPELEPDAEGNLIPYLTPPVKLNATEAVRLLQPYASVRFVDQVSAVVPLALTWPCFRCCSCNTWLRTPGSSPAACLRSLRA